MQLAAIDWLWDIPAGDDTIAQQINHADTLPVDYIEGIQSHEVTFTVPILMSLVQVTAATQKPFLEYPVRSN